MVFCEIFEISHNLFCNNQLSDLMKRSYENACTHEQFHLQNGKMRRCAMESNDATFARHGSKGGSKAEAPRFRRAAA
jgi:hypothetical protein